MLLIGLTGPSGAGKSTVAAQFASFGIPVLDADVIYHELLTPPSDCLNELTKHFGTEILCENGTLNRRLLAARVFGDGEALAELNKIAHAHVLREVQNRLQSIEKRGAHAAIFDAPQLFESGANKSCAAVVSVLADEELRLKRILSRDGIPEDEALRRMHSQHDDAFFREHSDYVIENNLAPEQTLLRVRSILSELGVLA